MSRHNYPYDGPSSGVKRHREVPRIPVAPTPRSPKQADPLNPRESQRQLADARARRALVEARPDGIDARYSRPPAHWDGRESPAYVPVPAHPGLSVSVVEDKNWFERLLRQCGEPLAPRPSDYEPPPEVDVPPGLAEFVELRVAETLKARAAAREADKRSLNDSVVAKLLEE